jgi:hypothetical protein
MNLRTKLRRTSPDPKAMPVIPLVLNAAGPEMYRSPHGSPIFNHDLSYWYRAHGVKLADAPAAKIVIFGIPKSGNVWLQSLLSDCLGLKAVDPVANTIESGVGMTHLPFCEAIADRADFLHGVCLVRDPRNVLVSFFHYSKTSHFRAARPEFHYDDWDEFYYEWYLSRAVPAFQMSSHSDTYSRLGVPVVRYERLRNDPARELSRLLKRWGLAATAEAVDLAVKNNDIAVLSKTGKKLDIEVPPSHFRKGSTDGSEKDIPPKILADFEERFSGLLKRWGYEPYALDGRS